MQKFTQRTSYYKENVSIVYSVCEHIAQGFLNLLSLFLVKLVLYHEIFSIQIELLLWSALVISTQI